MIKKTIYLLAGLSLVFSALYLGTQPEEKVNVSNEVIQTHASSVQKPEARSPATEKRTTPENAKDILKVDADKDLELRGSLFLSGRGLKEYKQHVRGIPIEPYGNLHVLTDSKGNVIRSDSTILERFKLKSHAPVDGNKNYVYWTSSFTDVPTLVLARVIYEDGWKKVVSVEDDRVLFKKNIEIH